MKHGYDVVWLATAKNQLAELWITVADRNSVAEAADRLDELLRIGAHSAGESREGK